MDMYEDSFKLHEMIDSDIRSSLDELLEQRAMFDDLPGSPTLTSLAPATAESMEYNPNLEDDISTVNAAWINGSTLYGFNLDIDSIGNLFVNPQTAAPHPIGLPLSAHANPIIENKVSDVLMPNSPVTFNVTDNSSDSMPLTQPGPVSPQDSPDSPPESIVSRNLSFSVVRKNSANKEFRMIKHVSKNKNKIRVKEEMEKENPFPKPAYSYSCLIAMALKNSKSGSLPVNEIYKFMTEHFPYFKTAPSGWKNSVRHNLSLNKCFEKIENPVSNANSTRKGCLWTMNPLKVVKMDEELRKWSSKNPSAIRLSMANPEKLEMLEKGEMKPLSCMDEDDDDSYDAQQPVVSSTEEEHFIRSPKKESRPTSPITVDSSCIKLESEDSPQELPSLENNIHLDHLELQKSLWEGLDEERLQFLGESLSSSSLLNHTESSSSNNQISFVHCNYVYSPMSSETVSSSTQSNQESAVTSTANVR